MLIYYPNYKIYIYIEFYTILKPTHHTGIQNKFILHTLVTIYMYIYFLNIYNIILVNKDNVMLLN